MYVHSINAKYIDTHRWCISAYIFAYAGTHVHTRFFFFHHPQSFLWVGHCLFFVKYCFSFKLALKWKWLKIDKKAKKKTFFLLYYKKVSTSRRRYNQQQLKKQCYHHFIWIITKKINKKTNNMKHTHTQHTHNILRGVTDITTTNSGWLFWINEKLVYWVFVVGWRWKQLVVVRLKLGIVVK